MHSPRSISSSKFLQDCMHIQNFEEGENCASTISVDHTFGSDMILFGSDLILLGSIFQVHELSVLLAAVLINFGVKKQVPQVSFKTAAGDLISFHSFGSDMKLFGYDMILFLFDMIFFFQVLSSKSLHSCLYMVSSILA